jgi:hypothetical protein
MREAADADGPLLAMHTPQNAQLCAVSEIKGPRTKGAH